MNNIHFVPFFLGNARTISKQGSGIVKVIKMLRSVFTQKEQDSQLSTNNSRKTYNNPPLSSSRKAHRKFYALNIYAYIRKQKSPDQEGEPMRRSSTFYWELQVPSPFCLVENMHFSSYRLLFIFTPELQKGPDSRLLTIC